MISIDNLTYKIKSKTILDKISFEIKKNEKALIYGSSGSGKTTLFNLILRTIKPSSGKIIVNGKDILKLNSKSLQEYRYNDITIISQKDDLFDNLSVIDNFLMFFYETDINYFLKKVNLEHLKNRKVNTLSGGERQKISILKECLRNNDILLCDEITSALDKKSATDLLNFILDLFENKTIVFISHDLKLFLGKVDRIINIEKSKLIFNNKINDLSNNYNNKLCFKRKGGIKLTLIQFKKNLSILSFFIFLVTIVCFYICFSFNDISSFIAKKSYQEYFNYDVLSIKDNDCIIEDNFEVFIDISDIFNTSFVKINNVRVNNINFLPFNNKESNSIFVINTILLEQLNIQTVEKIDVSNNFFDITCSDVDIIKENNMFTLPLIYFDFKYFLKFDISYDKYIFISDTFTFDNRFTNNPLYEQKNEDKPYLDSLALNDYLTFSLIFSSIEQIIDSYLLCLIFYCFIICILINVSIMLKDIKKISIFILKGIFHYKLLLMYVLPLTLYFLIFLIFATFINNIIFPIFISFLLQFFSLIISFYFISYRSLHSSLKEDMYL